MDIIKANMTQSPTILIIQTAFLGDVVLATALVESIKHDAPSATIDFVVRRGNEGLLAGNPGLRKVYIWEKERKYSSLMEIIHSARSVRYDYVINVQRFATTGLLTMLSGGECTIGFDKNPLSFFFTHRVTHSLGKVHEVKRNLHLLGPLGIVNEAKPRLYPSAADEAIVKPYQSEDYITVSPASVWFTKQFPANQWIEFLKRIASMRIFLLGGPGDKSMCDQISSALPGLRVTSLAGQLSLLQSAALMGKARMNYVNDSAPLHLASATNAPVTAVFCSTVPDFGFGPLSDKSFVVQTPEKLDCRPCGLHGYRSCPKGHFKCATGIATEQLMEVLE
jgi:ADP-heptose:LPS heptosyltransferase